MATSQENIKIELTRLAIKFKDISARGAKPADYKEIENCFRRLNQIYPFYANLDELSDVTISAPAAGEVLAYNATTGQWENTVPGSGSGLGDMTKAVYDTDNDGSVDRAETVQIIVHNQHGSSSYERSDCVSVWSYRKQTKCCLGSSKLRGK
jgi:hypothetical protein